MLNKKLKIDVKKEREKGFSVPHDVWLRGFLKDDLIRLSNKEVFGSSYFDSKLLKNNVRLFIDGDDRINAGVFGPFIVGKDGQKDIIL